MGDDYLRIREKENAKEWQMTEDAGVHKGNVFNYFNQYIDDDQTSDSAAEDPARLHSRSSVPNTRPFVASRTPVSRLNLRTISAPVKKRPITLTVRRDNAAKVAWRHNQPPKSSYNVGVALRDVEPNVAKLQHTLEEIGVRLGSFIQPERSLNGSRLLVWGNPNQVRLTLDELGRWQQRTGRPSISKEGHRPDKFTKISSQIGVLYALDEKDAKRNAMRQRFQRQPETGTKFKFNGYFMWPNNEIRAIELFGPNCEALDSLRMDSKAYISFESARSVFRVHTDSDEDKVNRVIQCIENTIREYVARDNQPLVLFLVEPPSSDEYRPLVHTIPGPLLGLNRTQSRIPILTGSKLQSRSVADRERGNEDWKSKNRGIMCTAVHKVLERIPNYRGHLRMRVNIGLFTLVRYKWPSGAPSVALEKFAKDVQQIGTKGAIMRNLELQSTPEDILDACNHAVELFQPIEPSRNGLKNVQPHYGALYYLRHPEKAEEMVQLEINLKANDADSGAFEGAKAQWKKRDSNRITPQMQDFTDSVAFRKPPPTVNPALSGYRVFTTSHELRIVGMEQKSTFRYSLKAQPQFIFELTRYDEYNGDNPWLPSSTQWAAIFYDRGWDEKLGENAKLGVGEAASWTPQVEPFFKHSIGSATRSSEEGFTDFLLHMESIMNFIDGLRSTKQKPRETSNTVGRILQGAGPESEQNTGQPVVRLLPATST
ncbi:MAG: hypothetical protein LQ352_001301 [Teloschistes flavicans]|nr:MAG: hypothetical protein LQ352_001301 [Teloschistes flavicans]